MVEDITAVNTVLFYVAIGVGFFVFSMLVMVFLFGMSIKDSLSNKKGLLGVVVLTLAIPLGAYALDGKTHLSAHAGSDVHIIQSEMVEVDSQTLITFTTSKPAIGYLVYYTKDGTQTTVLPEYTLDLRKSHSVLFDSRFLMQGELYIVAGGSKFKVN